MGKGITWQAVAGAVGSLLLLIIGGLVGNMWSDVSKIDVMQHQIDELSNNRGWMKSQQKNINRLKAGYIQHHGELPAE